MQFSYYLQTELKDAGALENSIVTEFVLYDIDHPRKNASAPDASSPDAVKAPLCSVEILSSTKQSHESGHFDSSNNSLVAAELHPELEIAAIILEVQVKKRECPKFKGPDGADDEPIQNRKAAISDCEESWKDSCSDSIRKPQFAKHQNLQPFTFTRPMEERWRKRLWWLGHGMPSQYFWQWKHSYCWRPYPH